MRIVDSRRMTGSNLYTSAPGVVVDIALEGDPEALVSAWRRAIARELPWPGDLHVRYYRGGAALFVPGPLEALLPLTELNEWAVQAAAAELAGQPPPALDPSVHARIREAHVPGLTELLAAGRARDVLVLVDDDTITVGAGAHLLHLPRHGPLPSESAIDWSSAGRIPIGIVTGTNGKTTTTRLVARIARAAGLRPGITSSDGVAIDEQLVHRGDFTGPEGTRLVLRHPDVEIAILETARGGILRRGLTVDRCDAALITNVSADHLGDYGVDDVATMARVKAVVGHHARTVILNANDPALVALASTFAGEVIWFSGTPRPGVAWTVLNGYLAHDGRALISLVDIPITFGARASYNIENALAASAIAAALGLPEDAIVAGLRSFAATADDNPGRGTLVDVRGVTVLLDFGHNPVAIRGVLELARRLLAERGTGGLCITIGMPGDRLDSELDEVACEIAAAAPTHVIVREMSPDLLRGRAPGEVPTLLADGLRTRGVVSIAFAANEVDALTQALSTARPGDLVVVLPHVEPAVDALLAQR